MNGPEHPTGRIVARGQRPYRVAISPGLVPQQTQPGDASSRQGSAAPGDRVKAAGLSPYIASPGLVSQEVQPDGGPDGQGQGYAPAGGGEASGVLLCPDTAFPGSSEPQIEPDDAFEAPGPLSHPAAASLGPEPQEVDHHDGLSGQSPADLSKALFRSPRFARCPATNALAAAHGLAVAADVRRKRC